MFSIKTLLPRTLFARSLLILVTPVILIQIITTFVFFDRHWDKITSRLAFAVAGEIAIVSDALDQDSSPLRIQQLSGYAAKHLDFLLSFEEGATLTSAVEAKQKSLVGKTLTKALAEQVRRPYVVKIDIKEKWTEVDVQLSKGVLHVSLPQRRLFSSSAYIFLLWMMGSSLILLAVAILFMRNQIRPIRRLAIAADRFGRGLDVPASFKPEGAHEVRQAGRAFLDMHDRIRRQIQQRTAMLAGVSHDLRTPLTRMKLQAAMLGNNPDVEALKSDIADMERMLNAYLEFARGEGGEQAARTDLREMLERICATMRREGTEILLETSGDLVLHLRPVAFERCLNNLVGNARKYADRVWLTVLREDSQILITVDDNGPGIAPDKYDDVFKPFVRGEPSRNPATGGVGLGLPIAQDIVHAHGGRIWLEKSPKGGLRVVVTLPL